MFTVPCLSYELKVFESMMTYMVLNIKYLNIRFGVHTAFKHVFYVESFYACKNLKYITPFV